jgi:hypothetical protein
MLRPVMPRYALSGGARSVWIVGASSEGSGAWAVVAVVGGDVDAVEVVRSEGVRRRMCMYVHVRWRSVEACRVWVCAAVRLRLRSCVLVLVLVAVDVDVSFAGALEASMCAGAAAGNVDAVAILWCGVLVLGSSVVCRELVLSTRREVLAGHGGLQRKGYIKALPSLPCGISVHQRLVD